MGCCYCSSRQDIEDNDYPPKIKVNETSQDFQTNHKAYESQQYSNMKKLDYKNIEQQQLQKIRYQAEYYKKQGNNFYIAKKYQQAIKLYQQALNTNKNQPIYYTNLALAYKQNNNFDKAIQTVNLLFINLSERAIENKIVIKAKIIKCRSLNSSAKQYCLTGNYDTITNSQIKKFLERSIEILIQLQAEESAKSQIKQLTKNLNTDIHEELQKALKIQQFLVKNIIEPSKTQHLMGKLMDIVKSESGKKGYEKIKNFYQSKDMLVKQVQIFIRNVNLSELSQQQEYLVDPILYQKFTNPFVVASGITYQEKVLRQHFEKNGYNDPITHEAYSPQKTGIINLNLKKLVALQAKKVYKDDLLCINL